MIDPPFIHPTAIIDPTAKIAKDAEIGPYCIIGPGVRVGSKTRLHPHVHLIENSTIGSECEIFGGVQIGGPPQDTKFKNEVSYVSIGNRNIIREYSTIHRATGEGKVTQIGDNTMLMAYAHIGHNCEIGNNVTIASYVGISGHVLIEDSVNIGGLTGVHQHGRVGTLAMIGGLCGVNRDIPPYMLAEGRPAKICDINLRGLRRAGIPPKVRAELRQAYKLLYRSNLNVTQALEAIEEEIEKSPELDHLLQFVHTSREGIGGRGNSPQKDIG